MWIAVYKCRNCECVIEMENTCKDGGCEVPTGPMWTIHKCDNGEYGVSDLICIKEGVE